MLTLPPSVKIFIAAAPVRMSKSYDGLANAAREVVAQDPMSGHLFVFFNRTRTQVKALYWDRDGFCVIAKRLERGCFKLPVCRVNLSAGDDGVSGRAASGEWRSEITGGG